MRWRNEELFTSKEKKLWFGASTVSSIHHHHLDAQNPDLKEANKKGLEIMNYDE